MAHSVALIQNWNPLYLLLLGDSSSFFTPTTVAWQELDRWAYKAEINFLDFAAAAESFESVVNYREKLISR